HLGETWWLWDSPLARATREVRFPRTRYAVARSEVDDWRQSEPAVVLVLGDAADRSMDYVVNDVPLEGDVLWVRVPDGDRQPAALQAIAALFPDRRAVVFDAARQQL